MEAPENSVYRWAQYVALRLPHQQFNGNCFSVALMLEDPEALALIHRPGFLKHYLTLFFAKENQSFFNGM